MKLILLNPYFGRVKNRSEEAATNAPPLGLGHLGTYVRDHSDCQVEIVDPVPQGLSEEDVLEKARDADIVGLGCFTDTRFTCLDFGRKIKEINPGCTLILGGPFVYFLDSLVLERYPFVDVIVRGEGEYTAMDIVKGKSLDEIEGIAYRGDGRPVRTPDRPLEKDIDDFYVDYGLLPDFSLYRSEIEGDFNTKQLRTASMILSRGCPFRCTYCANDHWQRTWRIISPEAAVSRICILKEEHGIEFIRFFDDLFTLREDWVRRFCEILRQRNVEIKFRVLSRVGTKPDVLRSLKEVGCTGVGLGIESGSDKMLAKIRKGFTSQQAEEMIATCKELGLWTVCSFIISLPGETSEDRKKTLELAYNTDFFVVNVLHLHPGTPLYNELKAKGQVQDEVWFDKDMPTTIHYCKDHFQDAPLWLKEAQWISLRARYAEILANPRKKFKQYGLIMGCVWIIFALIDIPLRGRLYKCSFGFRKIYRRLLWRGGKGEQAHSVSRKKQLPEHVQVQ